MAEEAEQKTTRRKSAPKPPVFDPNAPSVLDVLDQEINVMRQQLRRGEVLALPGRMIDLLPKDAVKGQRCKSMDWRLFSVFADWTGDDWDVVVYLAGKEQKQ